MNPCTHTPQALASPPLPLSPAAAMYQSHAYPYSFHPAASNPPSSPPPPPHHHYQYLHRPHGSNNHLYPPSPPQGASPSSDSGRFLSRPPSYGASSIPSSYLQRSNSALSLHTPLSDHNQHHGGGGGSSSTNNNRHLYDQPDVFNFQAAGPIRRVFSTGDIQGMNNLQPLATENCSQEVGGKDAAIATFAGDRVGRYTVEERKERIERYRSKRSHRNFQKKITYACRKTLADSRPRIRGRFARNGEAGLQAEAEVEAREVNSCNNTSPRAGFDYYNGWGPAMDDEEDYGCNPDFWANFFNNLSMDTLIPNDMYSNKSS